MIKRTEFTAVINFDSAHSVLDQKGCREKLHGHSWTVTVRWAADFPLDQRIFEHHFAYLKKAVSDLDHENLNDVKEFKENMATAEAVVELIFKRLTAINDNPNLISVQVEEEPDCSILYFKNFENKWQKQLNFRRNMND